MLLLLSSAMDVEKKTPCVRARPKRDWWAPCFHQSTKPYTIDSPGYRDQTGRLQSLDHLHKIRSVVIHLSQVSLTNGSSINVRKYWRPSLSVFIITSFLRHRAEYQFIKDFFTSQCIQGLLLRTRQVSIIISKRFDSTPGKDWWN